MVINFRTLKVISLTNLPRLCSRSRVCMYERFCTRCAIKSESVSRETFGGEMSLGQVFLPFHKFSLPNHCRVGVAQYARPATFSGPDHELVSRKNKEVKRVCGCVFSSVCVCNYITHQQNI
jgi:hypothetical protein